jgi:rhomboid protease GluP
VNTNSAFAETIPPDGDALHIPLSGRGAEIVLDDVGLRIVSGRRWGQARITPYKDITHFAPAPHGFWLGTCSEIMSIRRVRFEDADGPEHLSRALSNAIAKQPFGLEHLGRISEIHTLARNPAPQRITRLVGFICVLVYVLQLNDPFVQEVGELTPALVDAGQLWRIVTANFLHGVALIPIHLIFNLLGLMGLALLVERPLGSLRTGIIMGFSGLGAMLASQAMGVGPVIGASGIVLGLAGAALCLELHHCDRLPVWWRIPRRPFIVLLVIEGLSGFTLPFVAGEAHLGGFVAGYVAARVVGFGGVLRQPQSKGLRRLAAAMVVVVSVATLNVVFLTLRESSALERYAYQLLATPHAPIQSDNGIAWRMATESRATASQLAPAQGLAERAANRTGFQDPEILDTLAEVLFVRGNHDAALRIIDEAIRITRGENYYVEQRRRFTGERAFDDRPAPPPPWALREGAPYYDEDGEGILI